MKHLAHSLRLGVITWVTLASVVVRAEPKSVPLGPDPNDEAYVTEATLGSLWAGLDEQVEQRKGESPEALRKIDQDVLHVTDGWRTGSHAPPPVEGENGRAILAYGAAKPTVVCAPTRLCMIQLKAGETVTDMNARDSRRWIIEMSTSGATTYITVSPRMVGIETDLAVVTDQRVYLLALKADATQAMALVSFDYPEDQKQAWRNAILRQSKHRASNPPIAAPTADDQLITVDPRDLNLAYELEIDNPWFCRRRHNCVNWAPTKIMDDGKRTWITMPSHIDARSLPALFVKTTAGREQVAYRYKRETFTFYVDRVFNVAELLLGVGGSEGKVTLIRKAKK